MEEKQVTMPSTSFYVKDCTLAPIAIGSKAQTLGEFRDVLKTVSANSLYYHFWRQSMETALSPGDFYNDFARWAHEDLHDDILAERLSLIDPSEYADLEKLRADLIEIVDNRLDEQSGTPFYMQARAFHFIRSKIIIFNTSYRMEHPKDLVKTLPIISHTSLFYHFIDARRRDPVGKDDFSVWIISCGEEFHPLSEKISQIDPYFIPLNDLQKKLCGIVTDFFLSNGS